ncbi:hypothetical protein P154DRAFT_616555 [Amniculicola lignicola CBS 123094]|uniref:Uncharacterized protein n=1 Tax=Amniculicola lignicola CBS 123094 TaxID=1392246 RepID=A0A6A5WWL3_9PLEO|nr:hypothetical protein P154DRAFT_616555 [Amniculicola lignicola CBS 123094]
MAAPSCTRGDPHVVVQSTAAAALAARPPSLQQRDAIAVAEHEAPVGLGALTAAAKSVCMAMGVSLEQGRRLRSKTPASTAGQPPAWNGACEERLLGCCLSPFGSRYGVLTDVGQAWRIAAVAWRLQGWQVAMPSHHGRRGRAAFAAATAAAPFISCNQLPTADETKARPHPVCSCKV